MAGLSIIVGFVLDVLSCSLVSAFWGVLFVVCGLFLLYKMMFGVSSND